MAEIIQFQEVAQSMRPRYSVPSKALSSGNNLDLEKREISQTNSLTEIKDVTKDSNKTLKGIQNVMLQSLNLEKDNIRRQKEQQAELTKELKKVGGGSGGFGGTGGAGGTGGGDDGGLPGGSALLAGLGLGSVAKSLTGFSKGSIGKGVQGFFGVKGNYARTGVGGAKMGAKGFGKLALKNTLSMAKGKAGLLSAILAVPSVIMSLKDVEESKARDDIEGVAEAKDEIAGTVGGTGGALAGAAAGAAIGSVVPVIGTAIGGIVGGILGGMGGDKLGKFFFTSAEEKAVKYKNRKELDQSVLKGRYAVWGKAYFEKADNGNWKVYRKKDSWFGSVVADPDLIAFLEGKIDELPDYAKQQEDGKKDIKLAEDEMKKTAASINANSAYDLTDPDTMMNQNTPEAGFDNTKMAGKSFTEKVKSVFKGDTISDKELMSYEGDKNAGVYGFMTQKDVDKRGDFNLSVIPAGLKKRASELGGLKTTEKALALNAKRLSKLIPDELNNTPPFETERRAYLQEQLNAALKVLEDPKYQEALTEGETFKDRLLNAFFGSNEENSPINIKSSVVSKETSGKTQDGKAYNTDQLNNTITTSETKGVSNNFLRGLLADKGEVLERVDVTSNAVKNVGDEQEGGFNKLTLEKLKGSFFGKDQYRILYGRLADGRFVEKVPLTEKQYEEIKNLNENTKDGFEQTAKIASIVNSNLENSVSKNTVAQGNVETKPVVSKGESLQPVKTNTGTSVVSAPVSATQNTNISSTMTNAGRVDTEVDSYVDKISQMI